MALQVWLPLNGDLKNRGLADVTVTNYGATVDSNGKIGKCYSFDGDNDSILVPFNNIVSENFSISMWFYKTELSGKNYDTIFGGPSGFEIETRAGGSGTLPQIQVHSWGGGIINYEFGKWNHLVMVRNTSETKWYFNGALALTGTAGSIPSGDYYIGAWRSSAEQNYKGKINDFRIYDHCLSAAEVKEISKGLVLHYPLNNICGHNLLEDRGYAEQTGTRPSSGRNDFYSKGGYTVQANEVYTLSFSAKANRAGVALTNFFYNNTSGIVQVSSGVTSDGHTTTGTDGNITTTMTTEYKRYWITWKFTSTGNSAAKTLLFAVNSSGNQSGDVVYVKMIKLEKGEIATPYSYHGEQETIVYDASGYGNNGTVEGSLSVSSESPRYSRSTSISQETTITHPRCLSNDNQEWTCCVWIKKTDTNNSELNDFNKGNKFKYETYPILYLNNGDNDYYVYGNLEVPVNTWTHIAFVFRNSDGYRKIYINGIDRTGSGPNRTSTPLGIPDIVRLFYFYSGLVSDYREYSTALSESDIKELYSASAKIDKGGTLMTYEIEEY